MTMALRTVLSCRASAFQSPHLRILQLNSIDHGKSFSTTNPNKTPTISTNKIRTRYIHTSPALHQSSKSKKDLFTPSPFARRNTIYIGDKFVIHRELKQGDNDYGVRRYLLLPRTDEDGNEIQSPSEKNIIASLNANRNILFGAKLHIHSSSSSTTSNDDNDDDEYITEYLAACGSILDIAREDAAINGQQVQALCTLNGLCSWVKECLDRDGKGSDTLTRLMHGERQPNTLTSKKENKAPHGGKRSNLKIQDSSAAFMPKKKPERLQVLEAIRAIATGEPRPGHSVVGAGTYKDGMKGWVACAREYSQLATNPNSVSLDASLVGRKGLEEMALYQSRGGEVTKIEHLAHTQPEYLREAGGAMARLFFV
eukprot:CAMPEP_0201911164 /NCGR_PEP_ID=MMETSP0903-20130614/2222_1 /ASSEMBLY_ACC=CAM_ASM_000552 /TAXON_ID=420261 /ORGANISM="Thalassiosira antarctica, Strain CCMP982" /LENGTH=368 /DNA_ID=CAMNT_0048445855 /DNA_START=26 /DNA_END=1132 /DNA_ORIENTATION=+